MGSRNSLRRISRAAVLLLPAALLVFSALPLRADTTVYTLFDAKATTGTSTVYSWTGVSGCDRLWVQASGTFTAATTLRIRTSMDGVVWSDAVPSLASGEKFSGPIECGSCLIEADIPVHEGGGATVTLKLGLSGNGKLSAQ